MQTNQAGGILVELDEIESRNEEYPMLSGFLELMSTLTDIPVPGGLGAGLRAPGFDPYLFFLRDHIFQKFSSRAYKDPAEKVSYITHHMMYFKRSAVEGIKTSRICYTEECTCILHL